MGGNAVRVTLFEKGPAEGFPLVVLHGWGSSSRTMLPVTDHLADTFRILLVDMPGHGASPPPPEAMGIEDQAELVRHVIDENIEGPFGLVGHSNGGRISLHLAASDSPPPQLHFLVLISPSGIRRRRTSSFYFKSALARTLKAPLAFLPSTWKRPADDWLRHSLLWKLLGSSDYRSLDGVMRETFVRTVNHYLEEELPRIRIPVLLFRGSEDDAITREQMATMHRLITGSGFHELPGAGHYVFGSHARIVAAGIRTLAHRTTPT